MEQGRRAKLGDRAAFLDCVCSVAQLIAAGSSSFDNILQTTVDLVAECGHPHLHVRIVTETKEFKSEQWESAQASDSRPINYGACKVGTIEVSFPRNLHLPGAARKALEAIAAMLGANANQYRAEETIRQSEQRFRDIVENAPSAYFRAGRNGKWEYVNRAWEDMYRLRRDNVVGTPRPLFRNAKDREDTKEYSRRVFAGESVKGQFVRPQKGGGCRYYTLYMQPVRHLDDIVAVEGFIHDVTEQEQAAEARAEQAAAAARADELRRSCQRIMHMQESLRKGIAQRLHGAVQNKLIVALHLIKELRQAELPEVASKELERIRQLLVDLLDGDIRPISRQLYPSILRHGLVPALQSLTDQFETMVSVELVFDPRFVQSERDDRNVLPEDIRLAAYRIAEEGLTNVLKHAKASKATLSIEMSDGQLRISLRDNGCGFRTKECNGIGMAMIVDIAGAVNGRCEVNSVPGGGTEVIADLPVVPAPARQEATSLSWR